MRIGASRASNGTDAWHRRYRNRLKSLTFGKLFGINAVAEIRAIVFTAGHCPLVGDLRHYHPYVLRTPNGPACVCVCGGGGGSTYIILQFLSPDVLVSHCSFTYHRLSGIGLHITWIVSVLASAKSGYSLLQSPGYKKGSSKCLFLGFYDTRFHNRVILSSHIIYIYIEVHIGRNLRT